MWVRMNRHQQVNQFREEMFHAAKTRVHNYVYLQMCLRYWVFFYQKETRHIYSLRESLNSILPRPQCRIERYILVRVYQYEARPETRHGLTLTATIQA